MVRILTTFLRADNGSATVAGFHIANQTQEVRQCIGVTGQSTTMGDFHSSRQNLEMPMVRQSPIPLLPPP